ncbi:MAG: hypothetical protein VXZ72_00705 [Chlamydiota bacterium]|nr:hypothetical protein [Chlamydiota bacterium]
MIAESLCSQNSEGKLPINGKTILRKMNNAEELEKLEELSNMLLRDKEIIQELKQSKCKKLDRSVGVQTHSLSIANERLSDFFKKCSSAPTSPSTGSEVRPFFLRKEKNSCPQRKISTILKELRRLDSKK